MMLCAKKYSQSIKSQRTGQLAAIFTRICRQIGTR